MNAKLKKLRDDRHLSREVVAAESGVSKETIKNAEAPGWSGTLDIVLKLAAYYGVKVGWLVGEEEASVATFIRSQPADRHMMIGRITVHLCQLTDSDLSRVEGYIDRMAEGEISPPAEEEDGKKYMDGGA